MEKGVIKSFSSCISEYNPEWYEGYVVDAGLRLACDKEGMAKPFVVRLGLYGGMVKDYFDIKKGSCWKLEVLVFEGDEEMLEWLKTGGVVSEVIFLDAKNQYRYAEGLHMRNN
jgi:hypothetical protein